MNDHEGTEGYGPVIACTEAEPESNVTRGHCLPLKDAPVYGADYRFVGEAGP
jgi:hypothetical protein